ncbi:uncharacterized protein K02A2.6-like [Cydia strobilella]|uniref:uncharacterized protein K02A2.6-like n=1 Tax=Cydia strobilella TaxID=1100964 RepID=UPI0030078A01
MSIGKIREFDIENGSWDLYCERLEMYFKANSVADDKQLSTLIAVVGDQCYELMTNLASPKKPSELTFKNLVALVQKHLKPKPSIMAERYRFRLRRQAAGESISQYVAELKKLARTCDFKETLADNLRDQLVCGVSGDVIRQRLFAEEDLTYANRAVTLACSLEAAERDAAIMTGGGGRAFGEPAGAVHRVASGDGAGRGAGRRPPARRQQRETGFSARGTAGSIGGATPCTACGATNHCLSTCKFKEYICSMCRKTGHLRRMCPKRSTNNEKATRGRNGGRPRTYFVTGEDSEGEASESEEEEEALYRVSLSQYKPVSLPMCVNGQQLIMEIDTGAAGSFINKETYELHFKNETLKKPSSVFRFHDRTKMKTYGVITVPVTYGSITKTLDLYVVENGETSLLGREWLAELRIKIPIMERSPISNVNSVSSVNSDLNVILDRYKEVFDGGLGRYNGGTATLRVREGAAPVYRRARPLPFALRGRVDAELDAMLRSGVIEPVDCADWATPLVPVTKKDGGLRVCADFKVTLNPVLRVDRYPLPKVEELFANLSGGELFTKIDLSQAYNQICLSEDSKMLTVINTHRGLFKYNRLPYGLSSSSGIFCRISESIVRDIPNAQSFCDDILIFGKTRQGHLSTLEAVLKKLKDLGLKLKKSKCTFLADEVCYLGFVVSKDGIKPDPNKVAAVAKMPPPSCVTEVRSFLGMVNFYSKFIPNASDILDPIHSLLRKGARWNWTTNCDEAFNKIKSLLIGKRILAHYDPNNQVTLTCDASPRGVAGVLSQPDGQGRERPVAYVSRKLNSAEQNYSQIHREALAIVFSTQKFHQYLYGKRFTLVTDHKPLISIFGPQTGVPSMTSSRMQRWALLLMAYDFDIQYVNSAGNCADALSRLPIGQSKEVDPPEQSYLHFASDALFLDCNEVRLKTAKDPLLGRVVNYIKNGWPDSAEIREMQPYFNRQKELYLELDCVMWGHRVVLPEVCREMVLRELHEPHMGVVKTKAMARSYVWWPGMDEAIEARCRACDACAAVAPAPPASGKQVLVRGEQQEV